MKAIFSILSFPWRLLVGLYEVITGDFGEEKPSLVWEWVDSQPGISLGDPLSVSFDPEFPDRLREELLAEGKTIVEDPPRGSRPLTLAEMDFGFVDIPAAPFFDPAEASFQVEQFPFIEEEEVQS